MRDVARRFAEAGHVVLVPDLYSREGLPEESAPGKPESGKPEWSAERIRAAVASLPDRRTLGDLEAALGVLAAREDTDSGRLAAVGFCMGGNYAFLLGCHSSRLSAAVDFYGFHPAVTPDFSKLRGPVMAHFGRADEFVKEADAKALVEKIEAAGGSVDAHFYEAGHAFFNDSRPEAYAESDATLAWDRTLAFLRANL